MNHLNKISVIVVIFLCIAFRLIFFGIEQPWNPEVVQNIILQDDALGYHKLAVTMLESHRFAYSDLDPPDAIRTPLFPLFLSFNYWLFGERPWAAILGQIFVSTLSCIVLLLTFSRMFGSRIALIASCFYAIDPNNSLYSVTLLSDILFVFFLALVLYALSVAVTSASPRKTLFCYALLGVTVGMATLVRPVAQYIPLVTIVFLIVLYRHQISKAVVYSIIFLALFAVTISPWIYRNHVNFGYLSLSTAGSAIMVYDMEKFKHNQDIHRNLIIRQELASEAKKMMVADGKRPEEMNLFQQGDYWKRLAIKNIKQDPIGFARLYSVRLFDSLFRLKTGIYAQTLQYPATLVDARDHWSFTALLRTFLRERKGFWELLLACVTAMFLFIYYLGLIVGLVVARKSRHSGFLAFALLMFVYHTLLCALSLGAENRYRLPPTIFALPFIAIGLNYLYCRIIVKKSHIITENRG